MYCAVALRLDPDPILHTRSLQYHKLIKTASNRMQQSMVKEIEGMATITDMHNYG